MKQGSVKAMHCIMLYVIGEGKQILKRPLTMDIDGEYDGLNIVQVREQDAYLKKAYYS